MALVFLVAQEGRPLQEMGLARVVGWEVCRMRRELIKDGWQMEVWPRVASMTVRAATSHL